MHNAHATRQQPRNECEKSVALDPDLDSRPSSRSCMKRAKGDKDGKKDLCYRSTNELLFLSGERNMGVIILDKARYSSSRLAAKRGMS